MDANDLLRAVLAEFEIAPPATDRFTMMETLNGFLFEQARAGNECVLFIDEAQNLSDDLLEQVRLLSNLETDDRKLLQIVLMGQPELRVRLDAPQLRQLRQRIMVRFHLGPLDRTEIGHYVQHRLLAAGGTGRPRFTWGALWRVHHYSGGVPRLVNALCDRALLAGFVQQEQVITFHTVGRAIRELEGHRHR
jgi:general secretion pathway protein A